METGLLGYYLILFMALCYCVPLVIYKLQKDSRQVDMPNDFVLRKLIISYPPYVNESDICYPDSVLTRLDDRVLVFDYSGEVNKVFFYAAIMIFLLTCFSLWEARTAILKIMACVGLLPLSLIFLLLSGIGKRDKFIFDRHRGTISYTRWYFWKITKPFSDARFITKNIRYGGARGEMLGILHPNNVTWSNLMFSDADAMKLWSLLVWYMDKNRPLPLGTAFDPYRQADYDRRQTENFPDPLYPSFIPTPDIDKDTKHYCDSIVDEDSISIYMTSKELGLNDREENKEDKNIKKKKRKGRKKR
jgi:hypothetical protein